MKTSMLKFGMMFFAVVFIIAIVIGLVTEHVEPLIGTAGAFLLYLSVMVGYRIIEKEWP